MARRERDGTGEARPFATGAATRRLHTLLREGRGTDLTAAEIGLLRALIALADWRTGVIPYALDGIAQVTRMHRGTISRMRSRLCEAGWLVEQWRTSQQVQYALSDILRGQRDVE